MSGNEKKSVAKQKLNKKRDVPHTAQQTITYKELYKDGICRVTDSYFTKCIQFGDTNYQLAQNEDKTAIFEYWCDFYNYFDSTINVQLSCLSQYANPVEMAASIDIKKQNDDFDEIRDEYSGMLKT